VKNGVPTNNVIPAGDISPIIVLAKL
jgi:hypothetical protein